MSEREKKPVRRPPPSGRAGSVANRNGLPFEGWASVEREVLSDVPTGSSSSTRSSFSRPTIPREGRSARTPSGGVLLPPPPDEAETEIDTSGRLAELLAESAAKAAEREAATTPSVLSTPTPSRVRRRTPQPAAPMTEWMPQPPALNPVLGTGRRRSFEGFIMAAVLVGGSAMVAASTAMLIRELRWRAEMSSHLSEVGSEARPTIEMAPIEIDVGEDGPPTNAKGRSEAERLLPDIVPVVPSVRESAKSIVLRVRFSPGTVSPEREPALTVEYLRSLSQCRTKIAVEGWASEGGAYENRYRLARLRAEEIIRRLKTLGVRSSRLEVSAVPSGAPQVLLRCRK